MEKKTLIYYHGIKNTNAVPTIINNLRKKQIGNNRYFSYKKTKGKDSCNSCCFQIKVFIIYTVDSL